MLSTSSDLSSVLRLSPLITRVSRKLYCAVFLSASRRNRIELFESTTLHLHPFAVLL